MLNADEGNLLCLELFSFCNKCAFLRIIKIYGINQYERLRIKIICYKNTGTPIAKGRQCKFAALC